MTRTYEVTLDGAAVTQAVCRREGLYEVVECRCRLEPGAMLHLIAQREHGQENLGLMMPAGREFCLTRRIPAKRLTGELRFFLLRQQEEMLVPVAAGEPFGYLHRLAEARLVFRDGTPYITFSEKKQK